MTYGTLGKGTGRHQGDNFKTLSILHQPDFKFSANSANCIVRKKVETSQLKCSVAARNLHRDTSMAWQIKTLRLSILVWDYSSTAISLIAIVLDMAALLPKPVVFPLRCSLSLSQPSCLWTNATPSVCSSVAGPGVGTSDLSRVGIWECQLLWHWCLNNYLLDNTGKKDTNTHSSTGEIQNCYWNAF